jgi:hypothetical protein
VTESPNTPIVLLNYYAWKSRLGKTMIAQNICHAAVLAGQSVLFRSAASLVRQDKPGLIL